MNKFEKLIYTVPVLKVAKSNKDLLLLIQNGDMVAFYHLFERYSKRLYGFVLRYIKQEIDAEEIVQKTFMQIWNNRERINVSSSFESYLFTIAYNTTITLFRKKQTEKKYLDYLRSIQQSESYGDITGEIHSRELTLKVQTLVNKLTPRQKEVFLMNRIEEMTYEQIAQKLSISVNTVKKHMTSTLAFLKDHMNTT